MSSSETSFVVRLPQLPSPAMEFGWIYKKGKKIATEFARAEKCKGTGTVVSTDVFKAGALGWYLSPRSEVVDISGHAKGNRN